MKFKLRKLPLIPEAKANHVIYGSVASAAAPALFLALGGLVTWVPLLAIVAALVAGATKEWLDHKENKTADRVLEVRPHSVEVLDIAWTTLGGLPAAFVSWRVLAALGF